METVQTTTETKELVRQTVSEFAKENNFTNISLMVLGNVSGYPYIMFSNPNDKDVRMALYFSKNSAKMVTVGQPVTKQLLASVTIVETKNAKGEERFKLSIGSIDIESLLG